MWGNRAESDELCRFGRPIPTCVGQPARAFGSCWTFWAYPHVCGATSLNGGSLPVTLGLSPRVWGNRRKQQRQVDALRPIPTCVGQPVRLCSVHHGEWAYPHVCGATVDNRAGLPSQSGLSPRVWGNRLILLYPLRCSRPIPTCVGQPWQSSIFILNNEAYPHVCGATSNNQRLSRIEQGLSPRVWGNPACTA